MMYLMRQEASANWCLNSKRSKSVKHQFRDRGLRRPRKAARPTGGGLRDREERRPCGERLRDLPGSTAAETPAPDTAAEDTRDDDSPKIDSQRLSSNRACRVATAAPFPKLEELESTSGSKSEVCELQKLRKKTNKKSLV